LSTGLEHSWVMSLAPVATNIDLDSWCLVSFTTKPFKQWWSEYHQHLFCEPAAVYCQKLDPTHNISDQVKILSSDCYYFFFNTLS
jgi:hypothetical protein